MTYGVWVPLLLSVLLPLGVPMALRSAPPGRAVALVSGLAVAAAGCGLWSLALLAATLVLPAARAVSGAADPVPWVVGGLAAAGLLIALGRGGPAAFGQLAGLRAVDRAVGAGPRTLLLDSGRTAHALGGLRRGQVQVSRPLLAALPLAERRALLAHERAHLQGRHALLRAVVTVCARLHPALWRLPALLDTCCERAADERAAAVAGARSVVASAVARAALFSLPAAPAPAAAAFTGASVAPRVEALLAPALGGWRGRLCLSLSLSSILLVLGCSVHASGDYLELLGP